MQGWTSHQGQMAALPIDNIDTDQLIPARFMSTPRARGYGSFLLHDMARAPDGTLRPDFALAKFPDASILVARRNFGCGSSREAAVYALVDAGFRAIIAPSFGDIFASNAMNNGLLPAKVSEAEAEALRTTAGQPARIDLDQLEIIAGDHRIGFELDPVGRTKLMNGWDDIDLTRDRADQISNFRSQRRTRAAWAWL